MPYTLSGTTNLVGVIGWPVGHSVSPAMHNAAFAALGLDWCYVPLPVAPTPDSRIVEAVRGLCGLGLRGANVTVPHKQAVMPLLDELMPAAAGIGAVNTIVVRDDGTLLGDNTDARGFIADLRDHDVDPGGMSVLLLGAGGSARAVLFGLAEAGARRITVLNRTVRKAESLIAAMQPHFPACLMAAAPLADGVADHAAGADLIVNCTSMGMTPNIHTVPWNEAVSFRPEQVVYDLVYNPPVTRLRTLADEAGATSIGGLGMLIWQGAIASKLWTGQSPPTDVMLAAAQGAFEKRTE